MASKKMGRPVKKAAPGERVQLGVMVTPQIKERLAADAEEHGRSLSQQAELMIEGWYREIDRYGSATELAWGELMAANFIRCGQRAAREKGLPAGWDWIKDQDTWRTAVRYLIRYLDAVEPGVIELGEPRLEKEPKI